MITLLFEHDYKAKVLYLSFEPSSLLKTSEDALALRSQWLAGLKTWHSPYKALLDLTNLEIPFEALDEKTLQSLKKSLHATEKLLKGFFLKKGACFKEYSNDEEKKKYDELLPFVFFKSKEEACSYLSLRVAQEKKEALDLRSRIIIENNFKDHTIELSFQDTVLIDDKEKLMVLKDKLFNNLMHWHSSWNLLVDCQNFEITQEMVPLFQKVERFLKGFFLEKIIGYNTGGKEYPFESYRVRHKAALYIKSQDLFSGEDAQCASRKKTN